MFTARNRKLFPLILPTYIQNSYLHKRGRILHDGSFWSKIEDRTCAIEGVGSPEIQREFEVSGRVFFFISFHNFKRQVILHFFRGFLRQDVSRKMRFHEILKK